MNFRNPWIDPRVESVRPQQLLAYLTARNWPETRARYPTMRAFHDIAGNGNILVPTDMGYDRYVQDIIDAITLLAKIEERYAGDVLTDLLTQPVTVMPTAPLVAEKGGTLPQPVNR